MKKIALSVICLFFLLGFLTAQTKEAISSFWEKAAAGAVLGSPSAQAGSVVVALDGGAVKAYSWQGTLLWEYFASGKLCPFITRSWDGTSYFCRTNGYLFALNRTGKELWSVNLKEPLSSPVITGWDGRIFVPVEHAIFCYNNEGKSLWTKQIEGKAAVPPILDKQGGLLLALENGEILQISPFGKTMKFNLAETPTVLVSLDAGNGKNAVLVWYKDGTSECITGTDDTDGCAFPKFPAPPLAASEYKGEIAVVLSNGKLALLSGNGEPRWEANTGISSGEEVRLLNEEWGIYVLSRSHAAGFSRDGSVKWTIDIKRAAAVPAFGVEGVLYSGGLDWLLYAYRLEYMETKQAAIYGAVTRGNYGLGELPAQKSDYYNKFSDFELAYQFGRIREKIKQGQLGEDEPVFIDYLKEAAGSVRNSLSIPETRPPVHLVKRVEAVRLLASFGSQELIPFFADLFLMDKNPQIKAAVAQAIGRIGVDPEGAAMKAFEQTIKPPIVSRDEQVLSAVAQAVGSLCRISGPPMIALGVPILAGLAAADKPPLARKQALLELARLQN